MKYFFLLALFASPILLHAQDDVQTLKTVSPAFSYSIRGGLNIGGSSPLSLPASIRSIESYSPGWMPRIALEAHYVLQPKWGVEAGIMLEQKGMNAKAVVKNYHTTFNASKDGSSQSVTGYFTGSVTTNVRNTYLTIPLRATYDIAHNWRVKAGLFAGILLKGKFSGAANDGYMRDETPVGQKIGIADAQYDFSNEISKLNTGVDIGIDYFIRQHFIASAHLSYGATPVMKKDFESVDFKMYNLFLGLTVGYRL